MKRMRTIKAASSETGLPYYVIRNLCLQKKIAYIKSGNKYYVNMDSLEGYLEAGEAG